MNLSSNLTVETRDGTRLGLDVTQPEEGALGVAIILLHGGAWRFGNKADMAGYAAALAGHGFTAIAAQYRLVGEAAWPAQIEDVLAVVDWVAAHADRLGVRGDKIVLEGFSAGGHLSLLAAAARPEKIGAVISSFAPASLFKDPALPGPDPAEMLLGRGASTEAIADASPITKIGPGFPPCFLLGGMADMMIPTEATLALFEALRAHKVETELHLYAGHTHEFCALPSMLAPVQAEIALFLKRIVVEPDFYIQENLRLNMFARPGGPDLPPLDL